MSDEEEVPDGDEQELDFEELFKWIVECETSLEMVMHNLRALDVPVSDRHRLVVSKWLDYYSDKPMVSMERRLRVLRSWVGLAARIERGRRALGGGL